MSMLKGDLPACIEDQDLASRGADNHALLRRPEGVHLSWQRHCGYERLPATRPRVPQLEATVPAAAHQQPPLPPSSNTHQPHQLIEMWHIRLPESV